MPYEFGDIVLDHRFLETAPIDRIASIGGVKPIHLFTLGNIISKTPHDMSRFSKSLV
jgi:hypothetical protein